jgi:flagellar basal-body rod modification protein FlgD
MSSLLQPNTFLNLLVDELKYQNPMSPTSSADFMNQIAQLSQVEQLTAVSSASQLNEAESLIGKTVSGTDAGGTSISGVVTGVTNSSNGPVIDIGGNTMSLSSISQVGATGANATSPPPSPPSTPTSSSPAA